MTKMKWFTKKVRPSSPTQLPSNMAKHPDYQSEFLKPYKLTTRKSVNISQDVHELLFRIVRMIADKDITVEGYVDTVLRQHLKQHKDEINELYRRDRSNLIR